MFESLFSKSKKQFLEKFKSRRKPYLFLGLFLILIFVNLIYLGYSDDLGRLGVFGKKKNVEQSSQAATCNATATASWPSYSNCKVEKNLSWPYKVSISDANNFCSGLCPIQTSDSSTNSFTASNLTAGKGYRWLVCWPDCSQAGHYETKGTLNADASGNISFSWPALNFKLYVYDKNCSLECPAPNTPTDVSGTAKTLRDLWPSRTYTYAVCWPDCNQNKAELKGEFTTGPCSGSGATYSVLLLKLDGSLVNAAHDLNSTSYTFNNLEANKDYNAFIYSPTRNFSTVYWKTRISSGSAVCSWTEGEMQTKIQDLINENRRINNKAALTVNSNLVTTSRIRSAENDCINDISHTRPGADCIIGTGDDSEWFTVLEPYGVGGAAGEILSKNNVSDDLASVQRTISDWMNSEDHRDLILSGIFTEMGAGVKDSPDGYKYATVHLRNPNTSAGYSTSTSALNDKDLDTFSNSVETTIGTDPTSYCSRISGTDAFPPDTNADGAITMIDLLSVSQRFGKNSQQADWPSNKRYDMNGDGAIYVFDVLIVSKFFGKGFCL